MDFSIPEPLKLEHDELHQELLKATQAGGKIGKAAKAVVSGNFTYWSNRPASIDENARVSGSVIQKGWKAV